MRNLLRKQLNNLDEANIDDICKRTEGYSGSDVDNLCREASLGPIRSIGDIRNVDLNSVRPVGFQDFIEALDVVRKSVSEKDLVYYTEFDREFGSGKR